MRDLFDYTKEKYFEKSKGILTFVLSDDKNENKFSLYLKCAYLQALSLKFFNKNIKFGIIVYERDYKKIKKIIKNQDIFDDIIEIPSEIDKEKTKIFKNNENFLKYKNFYYEYTVNQITPYDLTIKTDSDIVWTGKLYDYYWENIEKFDIWFTSETINFLNMYSKNTRRQYWEKNILPNIYSAVFGFNKKSKKTLIFFYICEQLFNHFSTMKKVLYKPYNVNIPDTDFIMSSALKLLNIQNYSLSSHWKIYHFTKEFIEQEFNNNYHIINKWRMEIDDKGVYYGLNKLEYPIHIQIKNEKNIEKLIEKFEKKYYNKKIT